MTIKQLYADLMTYLNGQGWIIQIFLIVLVTAIVSAVASFIFHRLHKKLSATKTVWDDVLVLSLRSPTAALIWLVGLTVAVQVVYVYVPHPNLVRLFGQARDVGVILAIAWFLLRFIRLGSEAYIARAPHDKPVDKTLVHAISQILRVTVIITAALVIMSTLDYSISVLLGFGGMGALALSFAAKDVLANFFGGLMIYLDRPFKVGDWIRSPDKNIEGTVEYIGWRLTRIRTFDKRPLFVPNGTFSTISVENPSRMLNRRIYTKIGVRYDDATKIHPMLKDIENMLQNHPEIDTNQTLMVNLVDFGPSSLDFMIYTFTKTTQWVKFQGIQQDVFLKVIDIITEHGAECAFPTTTLHVPDGIGISQNHRANFPEEPTI